jgi:hypothetical protein
MRTRRCTGAVVVVGFEINVDLGRPVIVDVRQSTKNDAHDMVTP